MAGMIILTAILFMGFFSGQFWGQREGTCHHGDKARPEITILGVWRGDEVGSDPER